MKTSIRLHLLFVAGASLAVGSLPAADQDSNPFFVHVTSMIDADHNLLFVDGDSESRVRMAVGQPDRIIDDSVWVYSRFARHTVNEVRYANSNGQCDITLVSFLPAVGRNERKVGEIVRVNAADVTKVAAAMTREPRYVADRVAASRSIASAIASPMPYLIHVTAVVNYDDTLLFKDGDSEQHVLKAVGRPSEILPGEVWAFRRYEQFNLQDVRSPTGKNGCDITLVSFTPGAPNTGRTVTAITMVSPASLAAIAETLKQDPDYLEKRVIAFHQARNEIKASIASNP